MPEDAIDLPRIVQVLRDATTGDGKWSQRSLSAAAHQSRDCVGDIINGRNKNPTINVLRSLANAMESDLSIFGVVSDTRAEPPTEAELEIALRDMLPGMPRGAPDKRARYLAEGVARALRLPPSRPSSGEHPAIAPGVGAPPPAATN
jgi:hypothetical protein